MSESSETPATPARKIGRFIRLGLALIAIVLVVAAFARVIYRTATSGEHGANDIVLTVMHWSGEGGQEEDKIV